MSAVRHRKATFAAGHLAAIFASVITFTPVYLVCVNALKSEAESSGDGSEACPVSCISRISQS